MGGVSTWDTINQHQWSDSEDDKDASSKKLTKTKAAAVPSNDDKQISRTFTKTNSDVVEIKSDSEEEETVVLSKEDVNEGPKTGADAGSAALSEAVALEPQAGGLESQKDVTELSNSVKELSTAELCEQTSVAAASLASSKKRNERGRSWEKKESASPADEGVVALHPGTAGGSGGKVRGNDEQTNSGKTTGRGGSSRRGRGRKRKSNTKT